MKAKLLTAAIALAATAAQAVEPLTKDEIAKLRFMTALAYAEAIDVYCFPDWHYVTADLAAAAKTQAGLQNRLLVDLDQTREATSKLKSDQSACKPAKAFVDRIAATIPAMQPRMNAALAALRRDEATRKAAQARAERIAQCSDVVARVKEFLGAHWSLSNGGYAEDLPRCIADLSEMPEAAALLSDAKAVLPEMTESIKARSGEDRPLSDPEIDPRKPIADWCAKQSEKTALCDEPEPTN